MRWIRRWQRRRLQARILREQAYKAIGCDPMNMRIVWRWNR